MTSRVRTDALLTMLDDLWASFDALIDAFTPEDWQRKHGAEWTLADVPYHLAYFDHEIIGYPLSAGPGLPERDRIQIDSIAALQRWNASQFARRSAYYEPEKAVARWRTTRTEIREQLAGLSDADLQRRTWMALTATRGWRTAEDVCLFCLVHGWNEFMQLRYHAGRSEPETAPDVTHAAMNEFIGYFQARLDPLASRDRQFSTVWEISGAGGGSWTARVFDGVSSLQEGVDSSADLFLRMSPLTFVLLWNEKLDLSGGVQAGRIEVNDRHALRTFETLFPLPDAEHAATIAF